MGELPRSLGQEAQESCDAPAVDAAAAISTTARRPHIFVSLDQDSNSSERECPNPVVGPWQHQIWLKDLVVERDHHLLLIPHTIENNIKRDQRVHRKGRS